MTDDIWKRDEIDSPCVQVCLVHPEARICTGCYRTIDEISRWSQMSPAERAEIRAALPGRAGLVTRRRGGRRRKTESRQTES